MNLSRLIVRAWLPAIALAAAAPAPAGPHEVLTPAVQLALPMDIPAGERSYRVGDTVLDLPLRWLAAATLTEAVTVEADGRSERLAAGTVLPFQFLSDSAGGPPVRAYCTVRRATERGIERAGFGGTLLGSLTRRVVQSTTDRQLCLLDSDQDGRVDQSLVVNDGSPEARTPRAIAPAGVTVASLQPISGQNRLWLELSDVKRRGNGIHLRLHVEQLGHERVFDTLSGPWGSIGRFPWLQFDAGVPTDISLLGATMSVTGIDGPGRAVRLRWTGHDDPSRAVIISDRVTYCYAITGVAGDCSPGSRFAH